MEYAGVVHDCVGLVRAAAPTHEGVGLSRRVPRDGLQARQAASKTWRRLTGAEFARDVIDGVQFKDGIRAEDAA